MADAVPVQDRRIAYPDWPAWKPKMPFGQMPVLEVDGKMLTQMAAIGNRGCHICMWLLRSTISTQLCRTTGSVALLTHHSGAPMVAVY